MEYYKISSVIRTEATEILEDQGLASILAKYGEVKYTGSYRLDTMMKKDLDISVVNENMELKDFFAMGYEVSSLLGPHSLFHRNTRIKAVKGRPDNSLYWGVLFDDWNLDIWVISKDELARSEEYINSIAGMLNDENRKIILMLKHEFMKHPGYGASFGSKELYDAVLKYDVKSKEDFESYLKKDIPLDRK